MTGPRFRPAAGEKSLAPDDRFFREEVGLALRNRGMPLEALDWDITPVTMHYLLVHFDVPRIDAGAWRLEIGGLVERPRALSLAEMTARPAVTQPVTMECAGNGRALLSPRPVNQPWGVNAIGTAEWTGTPLGPLLDEAGVRDDAAELVFTGADAGVQGDEVQVYQRSLTPAEAMRSGVLLAWAMNGAPLEPPHGFPLRLIVPHWYGMTSVKWLARIDAVAEPFRGYQQARSYRLSQSPDDPGEPVTLQRVRAVMRPPGIPDYATRARLVRPGRVALHGRAWAGRRAVARVEVSTDGGTSWSDAVLGARLGPYAWTGWNFGWDAAPGRHTLTCRATDSEGEVQPTAQAWTQLGMANNMAQRIEVLVEAG